MSIVLKGVGVDSLAIYREINAAGYWSGML